MAMAPVTRAIFFDAAGTLVHPHPSFEAVAGRALEDLAPELLPLDARALGHHIEARMLRQRRAGQLVHYPAAVARAFWLAAYQEFLSDKLPPERAEQVASRLLAAFVNLANWALFPDVPPVLAALRRTRLTIGLLSNWEDWLDDLLLALDVRHAFDHVLVSGRLGVEKPDPAIFWKALELAGTRPAEMIYVGDSPHHDIEPCLALGIRPVLIDRTNRHVGAPGFDRITSMGALLPLLGLSDFAQRTPDMERC